MTAEHPIIFAAPMVRALIAGRKTETRRLAPSRLFSFLNARRGEACALWVRENFRLDAIFDAAPPRAVAATNLRSVCVWHEADFGAPGAQVKSPDGGTFGKLRAAIHMPRWACRLVLEIVDLRCENLRDLTEKGAIAEGVGVTLDAVPAFYAPLPDGAAGPLRACAREAFFDLWDSLHPEGRRAAANPAVGVVTFRVWGGRHG